MTVDDTRFVDDFARCAADGAPSLIGPTGPPDELFGVRLIGHSNGMAVADCTKPLGDPNPGWLMPMIDLLLARATLDPTRSHSCITLRIDLNVHPAALAAADTVRGIGRSGFSAGAVASSNCKIRCKAAEFGAAELVATGSGMFMFDVAELPHPSEAALARRHSSTLVELLGLDIEVTPGTTVMPTGVTTANPSGVVHGGAQVAALCAAVAEAARAHAATDMSIVHVSAEFMRPLSAFAEPLNICIRHRRRGRTIATYDAELVTPDREVGTRAHLTLARDTVLAP